MIPAHIGAIAARHRASGGGLGPTTYAYFRIYMTAPLAGADEYANLGKVEFLKWGSKTGLAANVLSTAADESFPGRGPEHLFDANPVSAGQWTSNGGPYPHFVSVQYNAPIEVEKVRVTPSIESPTVRSPKDFLIQGSSDGSTWDTLYSVTDETWSTSHQYTVGDFGPAPVVPGHPMWRIYCTALNGDSYMALQEVEAYEATGGNVFDPSLTASASSSYSSNTPDKAIDNDYIDFGGASWISGGGALPQWWAIDCNVNKDINRFVLFPQNYGGGPARAPQDFLIQYSDDAGASWTTAKTVTGETSWTAGVGNTFTW